MRDYWIDFKGCEWKVVTSSRRLKFKYPAHAALRAHVHHCDGYTCVRCGLKAEAVPADYDGRDALPTTGRCDMGFPILLVVDHMLTLRAGGRSVIGNLQTLCEVCNRKKLREDLKAIACFKRGELL